MAKYSKAGCEDPASAQKVDVISNRQTRPGVQMPGERTRKVSTAKAGQDVAGEANLVAITHGKSSPGRQTWKGARDGYTSRSVTDYKPSPCLSTHQDTEEASSITPRGPGYLAGKVKLNGELKRGDGSAKQSVKGKRSPRTDGEAKSVAGKTTISSGR